LANQATRAATLLAILAITACKAGEPSDPPSPNVEPVETSIASYSAGCTDSITWAAELVTSGPTDDQAILNIWDIQIGGGRGEEHVLTPDPEADDTLALTLAHVAAQSGVTNTALENGGATPSTFFSCTAGTELSVPDALTYAIRIYDGDGELAQCCAFGGSPKAVAGGTYPTDGGAPTTADELDSCKVGCQEP
jgi:hypothetical protein